MAHRRSLTVYDRALHLAAFSAQRLSAWTFLRKLGAFAAVTLLNIVLGAAAYRLVTGDPWWVCAALGMHMRSLLAACVNLAA